MIHRGCLSFLYRRFDITPQELWEPLYGPNSDYRKHYSELTGLLYCIDYYDMAGRNSQFSGYAIERRTPQKDHPERLEVWYGYSTMEDLRATHCFPRRRTSIDIASTNILLIARDQHSHNESIRHPRITRPYPRPYH